jgi:hypothetical protein
MQWKAKAFLYRMTLDGMQEAKGSGFPGIVTLVPPPPRTRQLDTTCCTLYYSYENNERCNEEPELFSTE